MLFMQSNRDDIQRYYRNTYVKFKETGDELFLLKDVFDTMVVGKNKNGDILELHLSDEHPFDVSYVLPKKSFFQNGKHALLLFRIPAKQFQRGIADNNTCIIAFDNTHPSPQQIGISFELLETYVNKPKFYGLDEAIASNNVSSVLSPRMAYHRESSSILVDTHVVAHVVDRTIKVNPLFLPEMNALVMQNQQMFGKEFTLECV